MILQDALLQQSWICFCTSESGLSSIDGSELHTDRTYCKNINSLNWNFSVVKLMHLPWLFNNFFFAFVQVGKCYCTTLIVKQTIYLYTVTDFCRKWGCGSFPHTQQTVTSISIQQRTKTCCYHVSCVCSEACSRLLFASCLPAEPSWIVFGFCGITPPKLHLKASHFMETCFHWD